MSVHTLCLCWRLQRADGAAIYMTDHDAPLTVMGETFLPGAAIGDASFSRHTGLAPEAASGAGALASDALSDADLSAGLWDRARVEVWRVDWRAPSHIDWVWSGRLSEVRHGADGFRAELISLKADLEQPVGRVLSRRCDAVLGDARCGVDVTDPAFAGKACDQRFETCRDVFANTACFRGFPHMPGTDFILSGPKAQR